MRSIAIPYGNGAVTLRVSESRLRAVLTPERVGGGGDERETVLRALENPIGSKRLRDLASGKKRALVITSDHTRPLPSRVTMPLILKEIRSGEPDIDITILIATGVHRPSTRAELRLKLGDEIAEREKIAVHDCGRREDMAFFGTLPSGGELWLNALVEKDDLVVSEGFIEPHFFAGFSGGRKSILPGVAARETVMYNHNALFIADPNAVQGNLSQNPIHRDMLWAAKKAGLSFILNVLLDENKRVTSAFAGDPEKAHAAGCDRCRSEKGVVRVVSDIVVTSNGGYPLDQNIYQSVKGMTAAEACVRPGGVIIMCAALGDGHGGEDFYRWFANRLNAGEVARDIKGIPPGKTVMDQWEAQILARVMQKAACFFVTGEENRALIESMHMRWAADVNEALEQATRLMGTDSGVTVIPNGVDVIVGN